MGVPILGVSGHVRPRPVPQAPLPPWDSSDRGGLVHTTPPPEFQPPAGYDPLFMRGDFNGITIPGAYTFTMGVGATMTSGPYQGLVIPWKVGANSTPPTMLMSPMLPLYPRPVQDAWLTESALRDYSHVVIADGAWNDTENGFASSPAQTSAWAAYVKSWGNYVVLWRRQPVVSGSDPYFLACLAAGVVDFYIPAEEIDTKIEAEQLPPILTQALADCGKRVPIGVHFTANPLRNGDPMSAGGGYPLGFPRDTFLAGGATGGWADVNGLVHLCLQSQQNNTAGTQGATLYYSRERVQLGTGDGGDGRPAPDSRVFLFETMASKQLMGQCDEGYSCLRSLEMCYAPAGPGMRMIDGSCNGLRNADGTAV